MTQFVAVVRACEFSAKNPGKFMEAAEALFDVLGLVDSDTRSPYNTAD